MTEQTAVVEYQYDAPVAYGKREELASLVERMRAMLNVPDAPKDVMYRAAQICVAYRLMPGTHVHVYKIGGNYVVDVGVDAWKLEAKRQCEKVGDTFMIPTPVEMTPEQVKAERGELYDPADRGSIATLYRRSENVLAKEIGIPYAGTSAKGFWRAKAHFKDQYRNGQKTGTKEWQPDTIPSAATAQDVANRRAIKKAIKMAFAMDLESVDDSRFETKNYELLMQRLVSHEHEQILDKKKNALPAPREVSDYMEQLLADETATTTTADYEDEIVDLQNFAKTIEGEIVEEHPVAIAEEGTSDVLANALRDLYDGLLPLTRGYSDIVRLGEFDNEGNRIPHASDAQETDEERLDSVRRLVNKICGWTGNETFGGALKSDILLAVLAGEWKDGLFITVGAVSQLRKDLPENLAELGFQKKDNRYHNPQRCGMVKSIGESIGELLVVEAA